MFNLFKKKKRNHNQEVGDLLFGDLPLSEWPSDPAPSDSEPWRSFAKAREHLASGRAQEAIDLFRSVLSMPSLESRHYAQAWHFLREAGVQPEAAVAKDLLGVVVEVGMPEGLDLLAAYTDGTARYFNYSGAGVVWDAPDDSLHEQIQSVLRAGKAVVDQIGPWEDPRLPAPTTGQARISMLTPSGLHFGQAPFEVLAADPLAGAVIAAATRLMQSLIAKTGEV